MAKHRYNGARMNSNPNTAQDNSVQPETPDGEKINPLDFPIANDQADLPATDGQPEVEAPKVEVNEPQVLTPADPEPVKPLGGFAVDDAKDRIFLARLEDYVDAMAPGKRMDREAGARHQRALYTLILDILKSNGPDFMRRWTMLLSFVHRKGTSDNEVFGARYLHRFINSIPGFTLAERKVFMNLLHLIVWTADPKGRRQALRNIVMESAVANIPVPLAADKLLSYYAV